MGYDGLKEDFSQSIDECNIAKSGPVNLLLSLGDNVARLSLQLTVYQLGSERYAVFAPQKAFTKDNVCINLRHCIVRTSTQNDGAVTILTKQGEATNVTFTSNEPEAWVDVLTTSQTDVETSQRSPLSQSNRQRRNRVILSSVTEEEE